MINKKGYRSGVVMVILNPENRVLVARRIGQSNAWQFPQGGMQQGESEQEAMFRELNEEVGLSPSDIEIVATTKDWLKYKLPKKLIRYYSKPLCIGQRQRWFLLRLTSSDENINFNVTDTPEFDMFRWVDYWHPVDAVISFKKEVYQKALSEFKMQVK